MLLSPKIGVNKSLITIQYADASTKKNTTPQTKCCRIFTHWILGCFFSAKTKVTCQHKFLMKERVLHQLDIKHIFNITSNTFKYKSLTKKCSLHQIKLSPSDV